jgi:hypothetical protein
MYKQNTKDQVTWWLNEAKKNHTTFLCSMKQNIQEFSAINHKFNYSTIELKQMQVFLDFKVLLTCKTHESKYEQKP